MSTCIRSLIDINGQAQYEVLREYGALLVLREQIEQIPRLSADWYKFRKSFENTILKQAIETRETLAKIQPISTNVQDYLDSLQSQTHTPVSSPSPSSSPRNASQDEDDEDQQQQTATSQDQDQDQDQDQNQSVQAVVLNLRHKPIRDLKAAINAHRRKMRAASKKARAIIDQRFTQVKLPQSFPLRRSRSTERIKNN
jgi:beta-phosphoglucomutase-like phosphatase (HAD superfamily)